MGARCRTAAHATLRCLNYLLAILGLLCVCYALHMGAEWQEARASSPPAVRLRHQGTRGITLQPLSARPAGLPNSDDSPPLDAPWPPRDPGLNRCALWRACCQSSCCGRDSGL